MKKLFSTIFALLLLLTPVSAFAATNTTTDSSTNATTGQNNNFMSNQQNGQFVGTNSAAKSNFVTQNLNILPSTEYWGWVTVNAKVVSAHHIEANWNLKSNDYIYGGFLTADLQRFEFDKWSTITHKNDPFHYNSSTKTPRGQFNFYDVRKGIYRVELYGEFYGRHTTFHELTVPISNVVYN